MKNIECKSYTRPTADYKNLSQCFRLASKDYSKQFAHIYAVRLNKMRECLLARVSQKWGKSVSVLKLSDLNETDTEECVIIGTLFKHQQLKPNILKEISEELKLVPQPQHTHFVSDSDELILEDELQRIPLHGNIDIHNQVTGVVVAIKGTPVGNGKFKVSDVCYATPVFNPRTTLSNNENKQVVFLSGINTAMFQKPILPQLYSLIQLLTGWLGESEDLEEGSHIVRIVIVGNTIRNVPKEKITILSNKDNATQADLEAMDLADRILTDFVSSIEVDLMPGEFDPANTTLPQQPLHPCLFPEASKYSTFHPVTNPYIFEMEGKLLMGTSGQPVSDIAKFSNLSNPLDILEYTLRCGHVAPTAPDTLACYPFYDNDPMIIESCPDCHSLVVEDLTEER
ncbi:hypothetical protein M8J76_013803 [Diaphorina citri]|nr:hypothetical protein M8J76_013803 [Diaphorina citri]